MNQDLGWGRLRWPMSWRGKRGLIVGGVGVLVLAVLAVLATVMLRDESDGRTSEAAEDAGRRFLSAWGDGFRSWGDGDLRHAADATDNPEAALTMLESLLVTLGPDYGSFNVSGDPSDPGDGAPDGALSIPINVGFNLEDAGEFSYNSELMMIPSRDGDGTKPTEWTVHWDPSLVHPHLNAGQTLSYTLDRPEPHPILAADGTPLAESGTVWHIDLWPALLGDREHTYRVLEDAGMDVTNLAEEVEAASPYERIEAGLVSDEQYQRHSAELDSLAGLRIWKNMMLIARADGALTGGFDAETGRHSGGLADNHYLQLNGPLSCSVEIIEQQSGDVIETLGECNGNEVELVGTPDGPLETTIDLEVQRAAEAALAGADDASIVAIEPSTGHVIAATGSLHDQLAPGGTFTIVTAAALLESGVSPDETVGCPQSIGVGGEQITNWNGVALGPDTTLHEAFAASCDTAFIAARDSKTESALSAFGLDLEEWRDLGTRAYTFEAPDARDENEYARQLVGQATVRASPLAMASVAATVAEGAFVEPLLVRHRDELNLRRNRTVSQSTLNSLREMMREVVTEGTTSAIDGLPGQPHAVAGRGVSESLDGNEEQVTSDWLVGYLADADLAFAVVANAYGPSANPNAAPLTADFIRNFT